MSLALPHWWLVLQARLRPQSTPPTCPAEPEAWPWETGHDEARCRIHEAGHALLLAFQPGGLHPHAVVHPGDAFLPPHVDTGVFQSAPTATRELLFDMHMALAGRAAERLLLAEVSDGSLQDLLNWESLARRYLTTTDDDHLHPLIHAPTTPAEAAYSATVLRDLRRIQDGVVTEFLRSNRACLEHVADLLQAGPLQDEPLQDALMSVQLTYDLRLSLQDQFPDVPFTP